LTPQSLVSVIVLTYNREELLKETLRSILAQTHRNIEVLVIDNCSDYDIEDSLEKMGDPRISVHRNANGGLLAVNRNFGISKASGDFIAFCDDDDLWHPEKLGQQLDAFSSRPQTLVMGTNYEQFPRRRKNGLFMFRDKDLNFLQLAKTQKGIPLSSSLTRSEVFDLIGGFDEDPAILTMEDFDCWLRVLKHRDNSIHVLKAPLLLYRVHEENMYAKVNRQQSPYEKLIKIFSKHREQLESSIIYFTNHLEYLDQLHAATVGYFSRSLSLKKLWSLKRLHWSDRMTLILKRNISDLF
jgi:teichuronic acid biosynthesis glycosyltransferase TuaG